MGGVYANFANVSFSQYEFTITFARVDHEVEEGDVPGVVVAARERLAQVHARPARRDGGHVVEVADDGRNPEPARDRRRGTLGPLRPRLDHRDSLRDRRVVLQPEVVEQRRVRLLQARLLEVDEELAARNAGRRVAFSADQSASASYRRETAFSSGAASTPMTTSASSANGSTPGSWMPPRRRAISVTSHAIGSTVSADQPMPLSVCRCATWPNSCATTTRTSPGEKRPSRIVFQRITFAEGPKPLEYAFACVVTSLTSWT